MDFYFLEIPVGSIIIYSLGTIAAYEGFKWCAKYGIEKNVSEVVPSDDAEMLNTVREIEAQINLAERTKREGNIAESNIQFTKCAKSLNSLLV